MDPLIKSQLLYQLSYAPAGQTFGAAGRETPPSVRTARLRDRARVIAKPLRPGKPAWPHHVAATHGGITSRAEGLASATRVGVTYCIGTVPARDTPVPHRAFG